MRRAARTDGNHTAIRSALRKAGVRVLDLSGVGRGCPDTLCSWIRGGVRHTALLEIKNGELSPSARALTPAQVKFHAQWVGRLHIVNSVEEALMAVGIAVAKQEG